MDSEFRPTFQKYAGRAIITAKLVLATHYSSVKINGIGYCTEIGHISVRNVTETSTDE